MVLEFLQEVVDALVHQHAFVDAHELAGLAVDEAQSAVPVDGEPSVVAVAVLVGRGFHFGYGRVRQIADAL